MSDHDALASSIDVGSPFAQEAEEGVIGACLIDPAQFINCRAFLKPADFFLLRHQYVWQAMCDLDDNRTPIDMITLAEQLENMGKLDEIGGRGYIINLSNSMGTSYYAEVYAQLVERTRIRRDLMSISDEIKILSQDELGNVQEVLNYAQAKLLDVQVGGDNTSLEGLSDAIADHMEKVEWRAKNPNAMIGIPTGFTLFDHITRGLQDSRLYLLAARPGMGKSAFMGNIAINASKQGKRVAWFSYEMTKHELVTRFTSQLADIDNQVIESGTMSQPEWQRYNRACGELNQLPIAATEKTVTPMMMRAMCRKMKHTRGLDVVFVDYIQLIPPDELMSNRVQEVGYVSRMLKEMAMELGIPVVAAAQLNRAADARANHRPLLSDLRESGDLEQTADLVAFIYSDFYYDENLKEEDIWDSEVIIAKQRNGGAGKCKLKFRKSRTQFVNVTVETANTLDFE